MAKKELQCEWCNGSITPFHELKEKGFICDDCYKELEREQERFEKWRY